MLNARVVYSSASGGQISTEREEQGEMSLEDLLAHVRSLDKHPSLNNGDGGISGTRGFMSITTDEFVLHAYFNDDDDLCDELDIDDVDEESCIDNGAEEPCIEDGWDGAYIEYEFFVNSPPSSCTDSSLPPQSFEGRIGSDSLKEVLRLLDSRLSPVTYIENTTEQYD